ncbi:predicted protein, partial [Arabidopsis lyrata subsp. lyrata]
VMCDPYTPAGVPIPTNKRHNAAKIFRHPSLPPRSLGMLIFFFFGYTYYFRYYKF